MADVFVVKAAGFVDVVSAFYDGPGVGEDGDWVVGQVKPQYKFVLDNLAGFFESLGQRGQVDFFAVSIWANLNGVSAAQIYNVQTAPAGEVNLKMPKRTRPVGVFF